MARINNNNNSNNNSYMSIEHTGGVLIRRRGGMTNEVYGKKRLKLWDFPPVYNIMWV